MALEAVSVILVTALAALLLFIVDNRRKAKKKLNNRAPHPPPWPIIGHLHLLNEKRPIHRILSSLSESYGPIMQLQLGFRPLLVISSSTLAKECFTTNDKTFASRPPLSAGKYLGYDYKIFGQVPYGSFWRNLRKMCTIQIFSASRIESFKPVRHDEISSLIRSLFESCHREVTPVNMKSRLSAFTFNSIVRMIANKRVSGAVDSEEFREAHHFKEMLEETFILFAAFLIGDYLPFLKWLDLQGHIAAMKKLHKKRDEFMQKVVDDHREKRDQIHARDLVDVLISSTEEHEILSGNNDDVVKATALSLMDAGTESSSVTIEWALASLLQHQEILTKAQKELDTHIGRDRLIEESDLHKLKYLQAIVKETLRLYPAAPLLLPHEATEACTVGGYHVPVGTRLIVNAWAIHRDPAVWERPTEFDPERFLKNGKEIDVKGQDFELIPFGSGRRMCPGISLALIVVTHTLGRLLQSFEWSIPEGTSIDMREGLGLTLPKAVPLEAIIKPRLPLRLY